MSFKVILFICNFLFLVCQKSDAQKSDTTHSYKAKLLALPVVFYTPEVRWAVGAVGILLFRTDKQSRTSFLDFALLRTSRKQTLFEPNFVFFSSKERFYAKGVNTFAFNVQEYWYPQGNDAKKSDALSISFRNIRLQERVLARIYPKFYAGFQFYYNKMNQLNYDSLGIVGNLQYDPTLRRLLIRSLEFLDTNPRSVGLGTVLFYDTRDNTLNPYKGWYAELGATRFSRRVGSDYTFSNISIDARYYKHFERRKSREWFSSSTIAFNLLGNFNFFKDFPQPVSLQEYIRNRPPINMLSSLGGSLVMRGFYRGRFRDVHSVVFQAELRQNIYNKLGMVFFGGFGEVAPKIAAMSIYHFNYNYGFGVRYRVRQKDRLNLRFDIGFGNKDSRGFYINVAEAF